MAEEVVVIEQEEEADPIDDGKRVDIHLELLKHYSLLIQHHKNKIRYFLGVLISLTAGILVFHQSELFNPAKLQIGVMFGISLILIGVYFGLAHHAVKLLSMCANRDHHEWHVRLYMGHAISPEDHRMEQGMIRSNHVLVDGPVGILLVAFFAWFSVISFVVKLWETPMPTGNEADVRSLIVKGTIITLFVIVCWIATSIYSGYLLVKRLKTYKMVSHELKKARHVFANEET